MLVLDRVGSDGNGGEGGNGGGITPNDRANTLCTHTHKHTRADVNWGRDETSQDKPVQNAFMRMQFKCMLNTIESLKIKRPQVTPAIVCQRVSRAHNTIIQFIPHFIYMHAFGHPIVNNKVISLFATSDA